VEDETLIVEDVMLMLLEDESGAILGAGTLHYTLGGAVLVELALRGLVEVDESDAGLRSALNGHRVVAVDGAEPADPLLRDALATVREKPHRVLPLLVAIGGGLREPVVERLLERGMIRKEQGRFLGIFRTTRLPVADGRHERVLRGQVASVLEGTTLPDTRTAAVAALLSASGVLPSLHPEPRWSGDVYRRGKELEQGSWGAEAVATSVARTAAAIAAASAAAAVAATTAATSSS